MTKRILATVVLVFLIGTLMVGVGCAGKEGQLPVLKTGDQWTYKMVMEGITYSVTAEVTEEDVVDGTDCYVIEWLYQPAFEGVVSNVSAWMDKSTIFLVKSQLTGTVMSVPFTRVVDFTYRFPDESWWPLEVGKEIRVTKTVTTTDSSLGQETTNTERKTSTYEVVRIEEITVPAGTFRCFKIVEHDTDGKKISETWYSDEVKNDIKYVDYESGESNELKAYSIR